MLNIWATASIVYSFILFSTHTYAVDLGEANRALRTQQFERAYALFLKASNDENAEAQYRLAGLHLTGQGTRKNEGKAMLWLERSAKQNYAPAQFQLGTRLRVQQPQRAKQLIQQAAVSGYTPAKRYLKLGEPSSELQNNRFDQWLAAARKGNVSELNKLYKQGQMIDQLDSNGRSSLFYAITSKSKEAVKWLLQKKATPNVKDIQGITPLAHAISLGLKSISKGLIDGGARTDLILPNGDSYLQFAIRRKQKSLIPLLIEAGVPVNIIARDGRSALDLVLSFRWTQVSELLRKAGAKTNSPVMEKQNWGVDQRIGQWQKTYRSKPLKGLSALISSGEVDLFEQVAPNHSAQISESKNKGSTLIEQAIRTEQAEILSLLLANGAAATPNQLNKAASTLCFKCVDVLSDYGVHVSQLPVEKDAISVAIRLRNAEIADYLFKTNSTSFSPDRLGFYTLLAARFDIDGVAISSLETGAKYIKDKQGLDALAYAAIEGNVALLLAMKAKGWPTKRRDIQGRGAFFLAVENGHLASAKVLLDATELNKPSISGNTPLMVAAKRGDLSMVTWLLSQSADPELRNYRGDTALIFAAQANSVEIAKSLIEAGALKPVKNENGMRAVDFAIEDKALKTVLEPSGLF